MKGTALIEYCGNGMYRYIDCDGNEHILREPIRCKDCKHSIPDMIGDELQGYECDRHYESYWDADDFCSRGEKR